jgi:uncharacterized membrane protein HdeD (DUF308 family)
MSERKASGILRVLEILLGLIAVILGVYILIFPAMSIVTITFFLAIALFFVGLFRAFWGIAAKNISMGARGAAILIGIIIVAIAVTIMAFPVFATGTVIILIDIGVLIYAIERIAVGASSRDESAATRGFQIIMGLIMFSLAMLVLFYPGLAAAFLGILLGIAFVFVGLEGIVAGIVGRKYVPKVANASLEP